MVSDFDELFDEFFDQGWAQDSKGCLVYGFLVEEEKRSPGLWDRLRRYLREVADEENQLGRELELGGEA